MREGARVCVRGWGGGGEGGGRCVCVCDGRRVCSRVCERQM